MYITALKIHQIIESDPNSILLVDTTMRNTTFDSSQNKLRCPHQLNIPINKHDENSYNTTLKIYTNRIYESYTNWKDDIEIIIITNVDPMEIYVKRYPPYMDLVYSLYGIFQEKLKYIPNIQIMAVTVDDFAKKFPLDVLCTFQDNHFSMNNIDNNYSNILNQLPTIINWHSNVKNGNTNDTPQIHNPSFRCSTPNSYSLHTSIPIDRTIEHYSIIPSYSNIINNLKGNCNDDFYNDVNNLLTTAFIGDKLCSKHNIQSTNVNVSDIKYIPVGVLHPIDVMESDDKTPQKNRKYSSIDNKSVDNHDEQNSDSISNEVSVDEDEIYKCLSPIETLDSTAESITNPQPNIENPTDYPKYVYKEELELKICPSTPSSNNDSTQVSYSDSPINGYIPDYPVDEIEDNILNESAFNESINIVMEKLMRYRNEVMENFKKSLIDYDNQIQSNNKHVSTTDRPTLALIEELKPLLTITSQCKNEIIQQYSHFAKSYITKLGNPMLIHSVYKNLTIDHTTHRIYDLSKSLCRIGACLENPYNFCYYNSALQLFRSLPFFYQFLVIDSLIGFNGNSLILQEELHYMRKLPNFMNAWLLKSSSRTELEFRRSDILVELNMDISMQHDVSEFLITIFNQLSASILSSQVNIEYEIPKICDLFSTQKIVTLRCSTCNNTRFYNECDLIFNVRVVDTNPVTLNQLIVQEILPEIITDFACDKCNKKTTLLKYTSVKKWPPYLLLQTNRVNKYGCDKLETDIQFDTILNISNYNINYDGYPFKPTTYYNQNNPMLSEPPPVYRLCCVIYHTGSYMNSGHYFSHIHCGTLSTLDQYVVYSDSKMFDSPNDIRGSLTHLIAYCQEDLMTLSYL